MNSTSRRKFMAQSGLGVLFGGALVSSANANTKETLQEKNKAVCRRYYAEALHNADVIDDIFSPNYVEPQNPKWSHESHKKYIRGQKSAFPDSKIEISEMIAEGDVVATAYLWTATHTGEWRGVAPTGNKIKIHGMHIFKLKNGKIVHGLFNFDNLGLRRQLGYKIVKPGM